MLHPQRILVSFLLVATIATVSVFATGEQAREINLSFTLSSLEFGDERFEKINVGCDVIVLEADNIMCPDATISFQSSKFGRLKLTTDVAWRPSDNTYRLKSSAFSFAGGRTRFGLRQAVHGADFEVRFERTDATMLWQMWRDYLPPSLADYSVDSGIVSGDIQCAPQLDCEIEISLEDFNFSGVNAAEDAALKIVASAKQGTPSTSPMVTRLTGQIELLAGAVYVEPGFTIGETTPGFLISNTDLPIRFNAELDLPSEQSALKIHQLAVSHPGVVELDYAGNLQFGDVITWDAFRMMIESPSIEKFYETYVQPVIFGTTVDSLELSGGISTHLAGRDNQITDLAIELNNTYFDDAYERFALYRLDGDFVLSSASETVYSNVTWEGASIYGIAFGDGKIDWGSKNRNVWISGWDAVSVFDGEMDIHELSVTDFGTRDAKISLSGSLSPVSMPEVMASFGLPPMAGKVSAKLPELSFQRNKLVLDGDIEVSLFKGVIEITDFEINELFSRVPRLYANVVAQGLDLETLTSTFSFGNISGTLDGHVKGLHLEAWQPVSFDAYFGTRENDEIRHRISRQAVDNLGRIGAQTSVLSSGWLRFIPNYSYGQLGLGCRFERGYCLMSGVANTNSEGFYVLTRGGLIPPWIDIKGRGKLISWQNLIDGIKQISTGEVAVKLGADGQQQLQ